MSVHCLYRQLFTSHPTDWSLSGITVKRCSSDWWQATISGTFGFANPESVSVINIIMKKADRGDIACVQ